MTFRRFIYNDDAGNTGGGAAATAAAPAATTTTTDIAGAPAHESILTAEQLKEYGIENPEQLQTILRQHKEGSVSAEEKQRLVDSREADLIKHSVDKGLMKVEDFNQAKTVKGRADRDLVYEKYEKEWREDNPDITDPEEIAANAKKEFEAEYRISSENGKAKARGEARLSKEASELRDPYVQKLSSAEASYTETKAIEGKIPQFNKFVNELIEKLTPEKLVLSKVKEGEVEVPIEVELSKEERKELAKTFRSTKTFASFMAVDDAKKLTALEASLSKKIDGFLRAKYFDAAVSTGFTKGKDIGMAQGSTVGAGQPFGIAKNGIRDTGTVNASGNVMKEVRESLDKVREKNR